MIPEPVDAGDPSADPGWRRAMKGSVYAMTPGLMTRRASRAGDKLTALRTLFVSFCVAIVMIGVVVVILATAGELTSSVDDDLVVALVVTGWGLATIVLARVVPRPLDGSSPSALATSYSTRFFLRIAFAESAALVGFVAFILTANPWLYPLGAAFTVVGFARLAPTAAALRRDEYELTGSGGAGSLVAALRTGGDAR